MNMKEFELKKEQTELFLRGLWSLPREKAAAIADLVNNAAQMEEMMHRYYKKYQVFEQVASDDEQEGPKPHSE